MCLKRWTVKEVRMDLRYGGDKSGWCTPSRMICIFFFSMLLHEKAVQSTQLLDFHTLEEWQSLEKEPYFNTTLPSNVTSLVGETVKLVCRVQNLGDKTITWIRHRDIHLLAVGRHTYTTDQRFDVLYNPETNEWTLRIRYAQQKDAGIYECQVSTTPPISYIVYLTILEPVTEVAGEPDLLFSEYNTINLTCLVKNVPEPPSFVIWSHNQKAINCDWPRGGISLVTERGPVTSSRLLIQKAIKSDSGLYTCEPSNAHPKTVRVHIVNENPAAMHYSSGNRISVTVFTLIALPFTII
ncbi:zwei Ig domain protein zig-8 isoform X2 [Calliopsis andreniformis]|uniref:zwei Ig domain protein zig-8 isoform X2 n=1 Tax=Calliopsis andreniformis TaxID=337506 RepID=UPI003FCDD09A